MCKHGAFFVAKIGEFVLALQVENIICVTLFQYCF